MATKTEAKIIVPASPDAVGVDCPLTEIVSDIGFRAARCAIQHGIRTVGDLAMAGDAELLSIRGFGKVSLAMVDAGLTRIGMCPGGGSWAEFWRRNPCSRLADRIYAAASAQTPEWRLAMITEFVNVGEADGYECEYKVSDLPELDAANEIHIRCYAAMILARDRQAATWQPCNCLKFEGLLCPEHAVSSACDECFMCRECGCSYGACECDEATQERMWAGRTHTLV